MRAPSDGLVIGRRWRRLPLQSSPPRDPIQPFITRRKLGYLQIPPDWLVVWIFGTSLSITGKAASAVGSSPARQYRLASDPPSHYRRDDLLANASSGGLGLCESCWKIEQASSR